MKHKLKAGLIVPRGRVTANNGRGDYTFIQGQHIPEGWTVTKVEPPDLAGVLGLVDDKPKTLAKENEGGKK